MKKYSNFDYMRKFSNNDVQFIIEMIDLFISKAPSDMDALTEFIKNKAWEDAYKQAHSYKSSVNFVANEAYKFYVVEFESNLKFEKNLDDIENQCEILKKMNNELIEELLDEKKNL